METTLLEQIVVNLPNFVFGGVALVMLYKQNGRLLTLLEKTCSKAQAAALHVEESQG